MKLPKTHKGKMLAWLVLTVLGSLMNYVVIQPAMYDWPRSIVFSHDLLDGIRQLLIAEVFMMPAIIVVFIALFQSIKDRQFGWAAVHIVELLILLWLVMYFAVPIVFPPRGL